jgi:hypothetical protein
LALTPAAVFWLVYASARVLTSGFGATGFHAKAQSGKEVFL